MMTSEQVFYAMCGLLIFSLIYPWRLDWPGAKWLLHLPLLQLPLWFYYETLVASYNIRLDLFVLIIPELVAATTVYLIKVSMFLFVAKQNVEIENARLRKTQCHDQLV